LSTIGLLFGAVAVVASLLTSTGVALGLGGLAYWLIIHSALARHINRPLVKLKWLVQLVLHRLRDNEADWPCEWCVVLLAPASLMEPPICLLFTVRLPFAGNE
jgi:hypothetical protein